MDPFVANIEQATTKNENFRKVLFTGAHEQLVVMTLQPGEELGLEIHEDTDQFLRVEQGEGKIVLDGKERPFEEDDAAVIPAGTRHNIINTSDDEPLKLYTIYAPPTHAEGTIHESKADADAAETKEKGARQVAR